MSAAARLEAARQRVAQRRAGGPVSSPSVGSPRPPVGVGGGAYARGSIYDEAKHPRGHGGKWTSKGGPDVKPVPTYGYRSQRKHGRGSAAQRVQLAAHIRAARQAHAGKPENLAKLRAHIRDLKQRRATAGQRTKWQVTKKHGGPGRKTTGTTKPTPKPTPKPRPTPPVKPPPPKPPPPKPTPQPPPQPQPKPTPPPKPSAAAAEKAARREALRRELGSVAAHRRAIAAAHEIQRTTNAEVAVGKAGLKPVGTDGGAYRQAQQRNPDQLPPGAIADRIGKYAAGDAKVAAVKAIGDRYDRKLNRLEQERKSLMTEYQSVRDHIDSLSNRHANPRTGAAEKKELGAKVDQAAKQIDSIKVRIQDANARRDAIQAKVRDKVTAALAVEKPQRFGHSEAERGDFAEHGHPNAGGLSPETVAAVAAGKGFLGKITREGDGTGPLGARIGEEKEVRAFYSDRGGKEIGHVLIRTGERPGVVVHEYAHMLEYRMRSGGVPLLDRSKEFLAHRVGDQKGVPLDQKFAGKYDPGETGRDDQFGRAFEGSSAFYVGKDYGSGPRAATEILSMGAEKLHDDPVGFARKDPEYAKLTIGLLDGSLR